MRCVTCSQPATYRIGVLGYGTTTCDVHLELHTSIAGRFGLEATVEEIK